MQQSRVPHRWVSCPYFYDRGATEPKAAGRYRSGTARFEHQHCRTAVPAVPLPGRAARSSAALPSFQRTGPAQTLPLRCFQTSHGWLEAESGFFFFFSHGNPTGVRGPRAARQGTRGRVWALPRQGTRGRGSVPPRRGSPGAGRPRTPGPDRVHLGALRGRPARV